MSGVPGSHESSWTAGGFCGVFGQGLDAHKSWAFYDDETGFITGASQDEEHSNFVWTYDSSTGDFDIHTYPSPNLAGFATYA